MMAAQPAKDMHFVITDNALTTEVGGPDVMRRQREHLLRVLDERPNITIQVLSATAAGNPAQNGGLIVLRFGETLQPVGFLPVVYGPATYFDDPADTGRLTRAFRKLSELAADQQESRKVIAKAQ